MYDSNEFESRRRVACVYRRCPVNRLPRAARRGAQPQRAGWVQGQGWAAGSQKKVTSGDQGPDSLLTSLGAAPWSPLRLVSGLMPRVVPPSGQ